MKKPVLTFFTYFNIFIFKKIFIKLNSFLLNFLLKKFFLCFLQTFTILNILAYFFIFYLDFIFTLVNKFHFAASFIDCRDKLQVLNTPPTLPVFKQILFCFDRLHFRHNIHNFLLISIRMY